MAAWRTSTDSGPMWTVLADQKPAGLGSSVATKAAMAASTPAEAPGYWRTAGCSAIFVGSRSSAFPGVSKTHAIAATTRRAATPHTSTSAHVSRTWATPSSGHGSGRFSGPNARRGTRTAATTSKSEVQGHGAAARAHANLSTNGGPPSGRLAATDIRSRVTTCSYARTAHASAVRATGPAWRPSGTGPGASKPHSIAVVWSLEAIA